MGTVMQSGAVHGRAATGSRAQAGASQRQPWLSHYHPRRLPSLTTLAVMLDQLCWEDRSASLTLCEHAHVVAADAVLMRTIAHGSRPALGQLYARYSEPLGTLAKLLVGNIADAEDLLHDVFLEAWQKAATFDPARGNVRLWLLLRLRSRAIDRLESYWRRKSVPLRNAPVEPARSTSTDSAESSYLALVVQREAASLIDSQRELLRLIYVDDLALSEAAALLGVPLGTLKSRLHRVLAALRCSGEGEPADHTGLPVASKLKTNGPQHRLRKVEPSEASHDACV